MRIRAKAGRKAGRPFIPSKKATMRQYTDRELVVLADEEITIETKILKLRHMSPSLWTLETLSEYFNISENVVARIIRDAQQNAN